jgi:hypothetical protein
MPTRDPRRSGSFEQLRVDNRPDASHDGVERVAPHRRGTVTAAPDSAPNAIPRRSAGVHPDQVGSAARVTGAQGIFHEPSPNGELAPPPAAPLPGVPAMPGDFVPPAADDHLRPDAERGADQLA